MGLVTLLASLMGMSATGIEIEEELSDQAQEFSQQHAIDASFINANIFAQDNSVQLIDYKQFELFFVYPWPNQIIKIISLFEQVATSGAVLVCYHGGSNDLDGFVRSVARGSEQQVYLMPLLGIKLDSQVEAQYLDKLAKGLGISQQQANQIHAQLGVPNLYG